MASQPLGPKRYFAPRYFPTGPTSPGGVPGSAFPTGLEAFAADIVELQNADDVDLEAFAADLTEAHAQDTDMHAEQVIYIDDATDAEVAFNGVVEFHEPQKVDTKRGQQRLRTASVHPSYRDTTGILSPNRHDRVRIRGEEFEIVDFGERQGGSWKFEVRRVEPYEYSGEDYRGKFG